MGMHIDKLNKTVIKQNAELENYELSENNSKILDEEDLIRIMQDEDFRKQKSPANKVEENKKTR